MRPSKRLNRRSAARALDRTGSSGAARVDAILDAATAPPTGPELDNEAVTVAMFRAAQLSFVASAERTTFMNRVRASLAAAKVGIAVGAATLLAGTAVALAATGTGPFHPSDDTSSNQASPTPGHTTGPKTPKPTPNPGHATKASLVGQCHKFQGGAGSNPGKALDTPSFAALVKAAGGKDNVAAYCTTLIGAPGSHPTTGPGTDPTDGPGDNPSSDPSKKPHPTHPAHPTKKPHPTHPAKPTQAASPTKKPHPTHPAHPTKTPKAPKG